MASSVPFVHLSPVLVRAAEIDADECTTALQVAALVTKVSKWRSRGYVIDTDLPALADALEALGIDLSTLTPAQVAEYQALIDAAAHAGSKTIGKAGTYDPADDSLDYYDSVTVTADVIEKSVTSNGVYVAASDGHDGYSKVTVSAPAFTSVAVQVAHSTDYLNYSTSAAEAA